MKLIDKDALVAEIERLKNTSLEYGYNTMQKVLADSGKDLSLGQLQNFLNTLEVKEVDLQEEPVSEELGNYINELSKQFPEVSFAKLSRIAVRVAKWQQEQFEKNRLAACDRQTEEEAEIERDFVMGIIEKEHRQPTFDDSIKYGMRLQKEKMMAKAVDGEVTYGKSLAIPSLGWVLDKEGLDYGDKVKLIIIKKE